MTLLELPYYPQEYMTALSKLDITTLYNPYLQCGQGSKLTFLITSQFGW